MLQAPNQRIGSRGSAEMPLFECIILKSNAKPVVGSASSSTSRFGKFGGQPPLGSPSQWEAPTSIVAIGQGYVDPDRQYSAVMPQPPNTWQL